MKIKIPSSGQVSIIEIVDQNLPTDFAAGEELLVEADGIIEMALVLCEQSCIKSTLDASKVRILRAFTDQDKISQKELKEKAKTFLETARSKVFRHGLMMKILDSDLSFDQKKLTFYFSADSRVDFRALVGDMAGEMNKMIRLQQVGAREESQHFGGFGKCGRPLCCSTFLNDLDSVSSGITSTQEYGALKSPKLAGCCGKPMCCLTYEMSEAKEVLTKTKVEAKS